MLGLVPAGERGHSTSAAQNCFAVSLGAGPHGRPGHVHQVSGSNFVQHCCQQLRTPRRHLHRDADPEKTNFASLILSGVVLKATEGAFTAADPERTHFFVADPEEARFCWLILRGTKFSPLILRWCILVG